jgi:phosphohistidine phosphatase SixA
MQWRFIKFSKRGTTWRYFLFNTASAHQKTLIRKERLTDQGRAETERIAQVAKGYGIRVARIVHSGKKRAEQTAAIYHATLSLKTPLEASPWYRSPG